MLYNAPGGGSNSQGIQITGNSAGTVDLGPLTSGPYAGLLLWQARTATQTLSIAGGGNFTLEGTFYAADALLQVTGSGTATIGSQYISRTLSLSGGGTVNIDYKAQGTARLREVKPFDLRRQEPIGGEPHAQPRPETRGAAELEPARAHEQVGVGLADGPRPGVRRRAGGQERHLQADRLHPVEQVIERGIGSRPARARAWRGPERSLSSLAGLRLCRVPRCLSRGHAHAEPQHPA
jgi:hypothetical protein